MKQKRTRSLIMWSGILTAVITQISALSGVIDNKVIAITVAVLSTIVEVLAIINNPTSADTI